LRIGKVVLAAVGPNTLSADEDEVFEQEINGVVEELGGDVWRRRGRNLQVADIALAHAFDDDLFLFASLPEFVFTKRSKRRGVRDCRVNRFFALKIARIAGA